VVLVDLLISLAALGAVFGSASARVVKQYERGLVFGSGGCTGSLGGRG